MLHISRLLKTAALAMAVFVTAIAIAGWWLSRGVERLAAAVDVSATTLDSAERSIDAMTGVVGSVVSGLESAQILADDLGNAGDSAAAIAGDVGALTSDRLAESVEGLEDSLPAMVEAADAIDDGLSALSILGVKQPEVPLGEGLRRTQAGIAGLGGELRARGAELEALGTDLAGSTDRLDEVSAALGSARAQVEDVDGLLEGYRSVIAEARLAVGGELWPGLVPAIRVVVAIGLASGLTVAWLTWRLAGRARVWDRPPRVFGPFDAEEERMTVRDIMTPDPQTVTTGQPVVDAAKLMRDHDIGSIVVMRPEGGICGMVTDRDITVKAVAEGMDITQAAVEEVCSHSVEVVTVDDDVDDVITRMRDHALRRIPVVSDGDLVGIISLGDLAVERDPHSALGDISAAPPNN